MCQAGDYTKRDRSASCLNLVGPASHCSMRDDIPQPAALGPAVAPASCQVFGSLHHTFVVAGSSETGVHQEPREQLFLEVIASMQQSRFSWALASIPNAAFCIKSSGFVLLKLKKTHPNQYVWHTTATKIHTRKAKSSHIASFNTCISSLEHSLASPATPQDCSNLSLIMSIYQKEGKTNGSLQAGSVQMPWNSRYWRVAADFLFNFFVVRVAVTVVKP